MKHDVDCCACLVECQQTVPILDMLCLAATESCFTGTKVKYKAVSDAIGQASCLVQPSSLLEHTACLHAARCPTFRIHAKGDSLSGPFRRPPASCAGGLGG